MSEAPDDADFVATLVALFDTIAASDPRCRRFGAGSHRWRRRPPLSLARLAAIEAETGVAIPADLASYVTAIADGGAGPYHGFVPIDHPSQLARMRGPSPLPGRATPWTGAGGEHDDPWRGALALAELGCDQVALLVVDGPARGSVWADLRGAVGAVVPVAASFTDFLVAHLALMAQGDLPPPLATTERCALPQLLSALLAREEVRLGREPGTLAGAELRAALAAVAPGSIGLASMGSAIHAPGEPIAPCVRCAALVERLGEDGLAADAVAPGLPPIPAR